MANSLLTGVSGLVAHQRMLNVVGNNLANMNTIGYKASSVRFADLVYETLRPASSGSDDGAGGINPTQVGQGVKIAQIGRNFTQGSTEVTGGMFDVAMQGQGLFVVNDGRQNYFTRAGAFAIDENQALVDPGTGMRVMRTGTVGEGGGTLPTFQTAGDPTIRIPFGAVIPGSPTTSVNISGNLSQEGATGAMVARFATENGLTAGGVDADATTPLNSLDNKTTDFLDGDLITVKGADVDGTPIEFDFTYGAANDGTTLGDLVGAINAAFTGATASIQNGQIVIEADAAGESQMSMTIEFDQNQLDMASHQIVEEVQGADATQIRKEITIVDAMGAEHRVNLTFTRRDEDNQWDVTADTADGTVIDGTISDLRFDDRGQNPRVFGAGQGDAFLTFQFNGIQEPQTVEMNFAPDGDSNGLFQVAAKTSVNFVRDGYQPGTIASVSISQDGTIEGVATNGIAVPIAQLAVAFFDNVKGLESVGDNYYVQSLNSGDPQIGVAGSGSRGTVQGGSLESSNVDVAFEFTQLIIAQRGFSANARTITVSSEVLEELTSIIR